MIHVSVYQMIKWWCVLKVHWPLGFGWNIHTSSMALLLPALLSLPSSTFSVFFAQQVTICKRCFTAFAYSLSSSCHTVSFICSVTQRHNCKLQKLVATSKQHDHWTTEIASMKMNSSVVLCRWGDVEHMLHARHVRTMQFWLLVICATCHLGDRNQTNRFALVQLWLWLWQAVFFA